MAKQTLAEQLAARGLLSERQIAEHRAQVALDADACETKQKQKGKSDAEPRTNPWRDLDATLTMSDFREIARTILEQDAGDINRVISKAHRFKDETQDENRKFIWFFYALRDSLRTLPNDHDLVIRRAFRRHEPTPVTHVTIDT